MTDCIFKKRLAPILLCITLFILSSCSMASKQSSEASKNLVRELPCPADSSAAEPYLFTDAKGRIYLSWIEKKDQLATLNYAVLENGKWSAPGKISEGSDWFVNWADYPMIASDGSNNLIAHFLQRSGTGTYTYDIKVTSSANAGKTWNQPVLLNKDGKKAEHGFVSMLPHDNKFFVSWLDGRNAAIEGSHGHSSDHQGEMTLRAAYLALSGNILNEWELDARVCDCCQTSSALTADGPVVVYRDRSLEEVRDISIVRFVNGSWTKPKTVYPDGWKFEGCPVNGPKVVASGNAVAVAWFSAVDKSPAVSVIFSTDGGATFQKRIRIDEGNALGRVDLAMLNDTSVVVSWLEGDTIKAARIYADGTRHPSIHIASTSKERVSGFPQMTASGNEVIFAWTDTKLKSIRMAGLHVE